VRQAQNGTRCNLDRRLARIRRRPSLEPECRTSSSISTTRSRRWPSPTESQRTAPMSSSSPRTSARINPTSIPLTSVTWPPALRLLHRQRFSHLRRIGLPLRRRHQPLPSPRPETGKVSAFPAVTAVPSTPRACSPAIPAGPSPLLESRGISLAHRPWARS
jgi:hypothetical protein